MTTKTTYDSPLEGLLTCGACNRPLSPKCQPDGRLMYHCNQGETRVGAQCPFPQVEAGQLDNIIIGAVVKEILTDRLQNRLISQLDQYNAKVSSIFPDLGHPDDITRREIRKVLETPEQFVRTTQGPARCRQFLGTFIKEIQVHKDQAMVHYALQLPEDSDFPGQNRQVIEFPK